jgi:hypothetical protein
MDNESTNDANGMAQISNELALSRRDVLKGISITTLGLAAGGSIVLPAVGATSAGAHWWEKEYRILQTNLREIDALQDPREIARAVKDFGATAIVSNIGGIVAFYPTQLELQYKNPYLKGDFVGEMLEAARSHGLTYIGRYDLSKAMKVAYDAHPEWFVKNRNGGPREYAGTYEACPNGGWAQEYGFPARICRHLRGVSERRLGAGIRLRNIARRTDPLRCGRFVLQYGGVLVDELQQRRTRYLRLR